jgi:hypothetical protein
MSALQRRAPLRPDLAAYFAIRQACPVPLERFEAPTRGVLAELARMRRP